MLHSHALTVLIVLLGLSACGSAVPVSQVRVPSADSGTGDTGHLQLVFNRTVSGLSVSVNGELVVEGASSRRLLIRDIESGYADLVLAGEGVEKATRVWIASGQTTALPLAAVPIPKQTNPLLMTALSIVAFIVTQTANEYWF